MEILAGKSLIKVRHQLNFGIDEGYICRIVAYMDGKSKERGGFSRESLVRDPTLHPPRPKAAKRVRPDPVGPKK